MQVSQPPPAEVDKPTEPHCLALSALVTPRTLLAMVHAINLLITNSYLTR